jgi:hypothetical protein
MPLGLVLHGNMLMYWPWGVKLLCMWLGRTTVSNTSLSCCPASASAAAAAAGVQQGCWCCICVSQSQGRTVRQGEGPRQQHVT